VEMVSTYNGVSVNDSCEAISVPPTLEQYWETRSTKLSAHIQQRASTLVEPSIAEDRFSRYSVTHARFLKKYFDSASHSLALQLISYWKLGLFQTDVARNTKREFRQDGRIELLIPLQSQSAKFIRVPGQSAL
jgi:hypothetical protein